MCPLPQPNQELLEGPTNLELQEGLLVSTSRVGVRPLSQPNQELLEGLTNLDFQGGLLTAASREDAHWHSQPNQELLEGLANLEFQEGLLASASMGDVHREPPGPTRNSWKGWPTWNSRKATRRGVWVSSLPMIPSKKDLEGPWVSLLYFQCSNL